MHNRADSPLTILLMGGFVLSTTDSLNLYGDTITCIIRALSHNKNHKKKISVWELFEESIHVFLIFLRIAISKRREKKKKTDFKVFVGYEVPEIRKKRNFLFFLFSLWPVFVHFVTLTWGKSTSGIKRNSGYNIRAGHKCTLRGFNVIRGIMKSTREYFDNWISLGIRWKNFDVTQKRTQVPGWVLYTYRLEVLVFLTKKRERQSLFQRKMVGLSSYRLDSVGTRALTGLLHIGAATFSVRFILSKDHLTIH